MVATTSSGKLRRLDRFINDLFVIIGNIQQLGQLLCRLCAAAAKFAADL